MAVEAVGAEKVDGKAVYDALCHMKNFVTVQGTLTLTLSPHGARELME